LAADVAAAPVDVEVLQKFRSGRTVMAAGGWVLCHPSQYVDCPTYPLRDALAHVHGAALRIVVGSINLSYGGTSH
jgi:hypothetical protein